MWTDGLMSKIVPANGWVDICAGRNTLMMQLNICIRFTLVLCSHLTVQGFYLGPVDGEAKCCNGDPLQSRVPSWHRTQGAEHSQSAGNVALGR
jgi:hypothetical protein